jgi:hypothetical protein
MVKKKLSSLIVSPYKCCRCGYETIFKAHMYSHLYTKKKCCVPVLSDIELTDEVKEITLRDRRYTKKKQILTEDKSTLIVEPSGYTHYVYLVWPKEYIRSNENIFKTGKTVTKIDVINIRRVASYGIGSKIILAIECIDSAKVEKEILKVFKKKFKKHVFGREFFIGDRYEMKKIITDIVHEEDMKYINGTYNIKVIELLNIDEEFKQEFKL